MAAASRNSEMDHADVDVAALALPVVLIEASGRAIRMVKKAVKAVSTSRAIAKALAALSANRLMVNVVDVAAAAVAVAVASVVVAAAMIVVVAVALDVVVAVAEIAVDAVVSDVVVVDAAAVVALATNHLTQRQSKTRKLLLTIKKSILS